MHRLASFFGRPMRHSGWYLDYLLRLFWRGTARFSDDTVHQRVICDDVVVRLHEASLRAPVSRLEDALPRMDRCSAANAEMLVAGGGRGWFVTGVVCGVYTVFSKYVLRAGFLLAMPTTRKAPITNT